MDTPDYLRIHTRALPGQLPAGRDTRVEIVHPGAAATPLPDVRAVYFYVDARRDYATAIIVAHVHADLTAPRGDSSLLMEMAKLAGEMAAKDARIAELECRLADAQGDER